MNTLNIFVAPNQAWGGLRESRAGEIKTAFLVYTAGYLLVTWLMRSPLVALAVNTLPPHIPRGEVEFMNSGTMLLVSLGGAVVASAIRCMVVAGVLWMLVTLLEPGGRHERLFDKVFGICLLSSFPLLVRDMLNAGVLHARGLENLRSPTQLYSLVGLDSLWPGELSFAAFRMLNMIDPFYLWYLALAGYGLHCVLRLSRGKAAMVAGMLAALSMATVYGLSLTSPQ